jgi:hypothetical protein
MALSFGLDRYRSYEKNQYKHTYVYPPDINTTYFHAAALLGYDLASSSDPLLAESR